ncbi:TetR family transcriptional regulator [Mycobacterium sp. CBMA 234]|uniref:TetR/AcrR family transcriptional regulator n=1 Tax=Mycolicibacterium sp. CBMA 234 TaxID=1918495 RepID=UPI0012DE90AC|nr:TetR/AcrR family transcriptional regulator [Mycolicibacterium sp. CBMA 234]MUL67784.1 TetR family transcriptional regulator [Mycolicibacterium sp. CBMA 234]
MSESAESGLRERKKADTRKALSDAALQLAIQEDFENVTREAIAALAGVSLRTFNNYFTGKYEALAHWQSERMRSSISELRRRPPDEPLWTSITAAVLKPLEDDDADSGPSRITAREDFVEVRKFLLSTRVRNAMSRDLFDEWVAVIAARTGTDPARDMYPRLVASVIRAVGDAAADTYAAADPPVSFGELVRSGLAQVAAGLPEPPRRRRR